MDKRLSFTGGEPDVRLDQILIDAEANRPAMHAMLESLAVGDNPNFLIKGCVVTVGGASPTNTWSMTAGYIYLNDEILEVESDSGIFDLTTEFLAFSKDTTYNVEGDKIFIDGTPRQTWQENRGIITVQGSVSASELDAMNGERISNKIKRYIGGGYESSTGVDITIANNTQYLDYTISSGVTKTITIPDPDDENVYNSFLMINITYSAGTVSIVQADSTVIKSASSDNVFLVLQNNGTTWNAIFEYSPATQTEALALSNSVKVMTPERVGDVTGGLKSKIVEIGDWNMDSTGSVTVAHGLTYADIMSVDALIRVDGDSSRVELKGGGSSGNEYGSIEVTTTNIELNRVASGIFDSVAFDSTSFNRGFITIWYI